MKLTDFIFLKNTPLTNFQNTIRFNSNEERDNFFLSLSPYPSISTQERFNWVRDKMQVHVTIPYDTFRGVNYCTFKSDFENVRYYAYVIDYRYVNDNVVEVDLLVDGIMTFCQGTVINNLENLTVERSHLLRHDYNTRLRQLRNNDDVLKTTSKRYTHENELLFKDFLVLIETSVSLQNEFGDEDNPRIKSADGITFDNVSSPVSLYVVKQSDFKRFMSIMYNYPWISQNFRKLSLIPSVFLEGSYTKVNMLVSDFDGLYKLNNNGTSNRAGVYQLLQDFSKSMNDLYKIFGLDENEDKHLLRNEYTTTEVYTYDGQEFLVDNSQLNELRGLEFKAVIMSGLNTEVGIYIDGYKGDNDIRGSFINHGIFFRNFDEIPILIDNYNLSMSKSASSRELAESRLVSNRIDNVMDSSADTQDRFYDSVSLLSNINPITLFGKFNDEYEFYKNQQAEFKDLKLQGDTITNQTHNNNLAISNKYFGLHVKHSQPNKTEWDKIKKYYKYYGYEINSDNSKVRNNNMTIADYVRFKGEINIPNVPIALLEMMKAQFENGVRFWHNNNTPNPFTQNILNNKMR